MIMHRALGLSPSPHLKKQLSQKMQKKGILKNPDNPIKVTIIIIEIIIMDIIIIDIIIIDIIIIICHHYLSSFVIICHHQH